MPTALLFVKDSKVNLLGEYTPLVFVYPKHLSEQGLSSLVSKTQRGGAGNVESPRLGPDRGRRGSQDIIPETALREGQENYHTGVSLSVHT